VRVGHQLHCVRIDHLLQTKCMYPKEAFEQDILDEDTVPERTQRVCPSTPPSPAVLTNVSERIQESVSMMQTQDPVRVLEPTPRLQTQNLAVRQESIPLSQNQNPVTVEALVPKPRTPKPVTVPERKLRSSAPDQCASVQRDSLKRAERQTLLHSIETFVQRYLIQFVQIFICYSSSTQRKS